MKDLNQKKMAIGSEERCFILHKLESYVLNQLKESTCSLTLTKFNESSVNMRATIAKDGWQIYLKFWSHDLEQKNIKYIDIVNVRWSKKSGDYRAVLLELLCEIARMYSYQFIRVDRPYYECSEFWDEMGFSLWEYHENEYFLVFSEELFNCIDQYKAKKFRC